MARFLQPLHLTVYCRFYSKAFGSKNVRRFAFLHIAKHIWKITVCHNSLVKAVLQDLSRVGNKVLKM